MSEAISGGKFFGEEGGGEAKYEVSHVVGKGSYGIVCAAQNRQTHEKVAIKHIDRVLADKADTIRIIRELRFLRLLQHPNIIAVHDVLLPSARTAFDSIYIVFELLDTDLSHLIRSKTKYDEVHIQWLLYQLFAGLRHIHAARVFHRDLKPGNILVNANCDLKICDFGLARADFADVSKHTVFWTDYVATRWYRAPELICSYFTRYSAAVDIWAAGCICAELLRRKPLFPGHSVYHQIELITNLTGTPTEEEISKVRNQKAREYLSSLAVKPRPDWHPLFPGCHPLSVDLLTTLLTFDPDLRQSAAEAMNHPYFEMFKNVGHDRLAVPPPVMTKADFSWESEKSLTKQQLREILYQEIAKYHPESEEQHARFAPTASNEVREQFSALERGDKPARVTSTSMPAEQTAPLFAQAQKMASQGTLEETEMIDVGEECADGELASPVHRVPVPNSGDESHSSDSMRMDGDDDVLPDEYAYARPQTISADDVAKLASSAVESITPGIDEEAMDRAAMSMADATTRSTPWQQLSHRQNAAGAVPTDADGGGEKLPAPAVQARTRGSRAMSAGDQGAARGRRSGGSGTGGRSSARVAGGAASRDLLDVMRDKKMKRREHHPGVAAVVASEHDLDMSPRGEVDATEEYSDDDVSDGEDVDDEDDTMMGHIDGEADMSSGDDESGNEDEINDRSDGSGDGRSGSGGGGQEGDEGEQCIVQ